MHKNRPLAVAQPRWRPVAMNVAILVCCLMSAATAASTWQARTHPELPSSVSTSEGTMYLLASMLGAIALCFRRRPRCLVPTAIAACLPALALPTDALPALIAAATVTVWSTSVWARIGVSVLSATATGLSIWRDTRGPHLNTSFWNGLFHSTSEKSWPPMPLWQVCILTALCLCVSLGIATLRRTRREKTRAESHAEAAIQTASHLRQDATRRDEREALAREVHDVLGHRLSILSMQASALEIEAADAHEAVRNRAHHIQQGAADSMADLRSLLTLLREGPGHNERPSDLTDIAELVRESIAAGTPVSSNVFVDRSTPLDEVVSRSAHRIATEMLTNARKHAPGMLVSLEIFGDPKAGLTLSATNLANPAAQPARAVHSGLTGMATRAQELGGTFSAGLTADGRFFTATAHLPWHTPHH